MFITTYRKLVAEHSRMLAFERGIEAAVRPGDTVCEIGTGLGTYAFFASRAGAAKVYAIDEGPIIEIAQKLYKANQEDLGQIEFINRHSASVHLPEKVDVVIYEIFDSQGLKPLQESLLEDARQRFLKPGGTFIPYGMELFWVPLQAEDIWRQEISCLEESGEKVLGLDYSLTKKLALNDRVQSQLEADKLLSSPIMLHSINFNDIQQMEFHRELKIEITTPGTLHGFGSWADLLFPGGHRFSLSYDKPVTYYLRAFFPLPEHVSVEPGDYINMKVSVMKRPLPTHIWTWWGEIVGRNGQNKKKWQSSTLHVAPFEPQDTYLRRALEPDYRPVLNKEGHLRRFVLEQTNGKNTVEVIACELLKHFPEEIPSLGEAHTKVTRIIKKCSS